MGGSAYNRFLEFLAQNPGPCEQLVCGTCGGTLHFLSRLGDVFPVREDLIECLAGLTGTDAEQITSHRESVRAVFRLLPAEAQQSVLRAWMRTIRHDSRLAVSVLFWTDYGKGAAPDLVHDMLVATEPRLVSDRALRITLRSDLPAGIELPPILKASIEQDIRQETEQLKWQALMARQRQEYLDGISAMRFPDRVRCILSDSSIRLGDWREEWGTVGEHELDSLDAGEVQLLIDLCEGSQSYRWTAALKSLYDRRHQLRGAAMEAFRRQYVHKSAHDQFLILVRNDSTPIESYPIELASEVTRAWIDQLTDAEKSHFLGLLHRTRLRRWKRVLKEYGLC